MNAVLLAVAVCVSCLGGPLEAAGGGLRRVRRGWMWNQFFLQEEFTGSERQYIGKVGTRVSRGPRVLQGLSQNAVFWSGLPDGW